MPTTDEKLEAEKPDPRLAGNECVIPEPIPVEEAGRYGVRRDPHAEEDIRRYVDGQCHGEEFVKHAERVTTEAVLGTLYEVWDVTTDKDRWWVITNPTNLYSQRTFPSLDYTLSFHVGLMMRVQSNQGGQDGGDPSPFDEVLRRREQASELLVRAVEVEELQAVGMQLRECLLALIAAMRRRIDVPGDVEAPKGADFRNWSDLLMGQLCAGSSNKVLRHYLKETAYETWDLANWLTHTTSATRTSAAICLEAVNTVIGHYLSVFAKEKADTIEVCPTCSSRNVRSHWDPQLGDDGEYFHSCGRCGWDDHPSISDDEPDDEPDAG